MFGNDRPMTDLDRIAFEAISIASKYPTNTAYPAAVRADDTPTVRIGSKSLVSLSTVPEIVARYGATGKSVRAICAARGWRWTTQGAPAEWYAARRTGIGGEFERAVISGR